MMKIKKNNISLIGLPGAGKTTLGKIISDELNMKFIDTDTYIEKSSNKKISQIFKEGEEFFRDIEIKALKNITYNLQNTVLSTGGGIILRDENINILREKTYIIFIDRKVEDIIKTLDESSRPLLKKNKEKSLEKIYSERYHIYDDIADYKVKNNSSIEEISEKIIMKWKSYEENYK